MRRLVRSLPALVTLLARTLVVAFGLTPALAQGPAEAPVSEGMAVISEGAGVSLRWSLPDDVFPAGGFVVSRLESGGSSLSWTVPSPLPPAQSLVDQETYAAALEIHDPNFTPTGLDEETQDGLALLRAFFDLEAAANPDLAETLGILYHDIGLTIGQRVSYEVRTAGGTLVGTASITVGSTGPLVAPAGLRATPTAEGIELIWDRPNEETLVFAYLIEVISQDGSVGLLSENWSTIPAEEEPGEVPAPFWAKDEGRQPGDVLRYRIVGRDLFGRLTPRSEEALVVVPDPFGLPQPIVVDAETGDRTITLRWAVEPDERVAAAVVLRALSLEAEPESVSPALHPSTRSWTDEGLRGGVDYHYYVAVVDADGRSAASPIWTQRAVNPNPPGAPAALKLTPTETSLTLGWTPPPEDDVGRYQVFTARPGTPFEQMTFVGETVNSSFEMPVPANTLFEVAFRVRAVNTSDIAGPPSAEGSGRVVDLTPPSVPLWRTVEGGEKLVTLAWIRDLDPDVATLRLLRSPTGEGAFELLAGDLAPSVVSFVDLDVVPGLAYDYVLQAVDAAGNVSATSEIMTATAWSLDAPAPVAGLAAVVVEGGGVRLCWHAAEPGDGWVVSRMLDGVWVEISDLLSAPEFVDARGQVGDSYLVVGLSATGQVGEGVVVGVE